MTRNKVGGKGIDYYIKCDGITIGFSGKSLSLTLARHQTPSQITAVIEDFLQDLAEFLIEEKERELKIEKYNDLYSNFKIHPIIKKGVLVLETPEGFNQLHLEAMIKGLKELYRAFDVDITVQIIIVPTMTGKEG